MTEAEEKELKILEAMDAGKISKDEAFELLELEGVTAQKSKKEESSILSDVGSAALKALDYTSGAGRTAAMGVADLARLTASGFDFDNFKPTSRPGDFTRMVKGEAPTTEEMLDRSGMEEGALRTGIGFAGDVALDPATYLTAGVGAAAKLGKLGTALTAADKVVGAGLKGIGKAYKGATRGAATKVASAISGTDVDALKAYIKDPEAVKKVAENVFENTDVAVSQAKTNVLAKKSQVSELMNEELRKSGKMIDISGIKNALDGKIDNLMNLERRSPQQDELLDQMLDLKDNAFSDIVGGAKDDIPDLIDADRMFDLKESLRRSKGSSTIFDAKTGQVKQVDARFKSLSKDLYGQVNKQVDNTFKDAKTLRDAFTEVGNDYNFLNKRFKQDIVRPDADTNALLRLSKNKETKKKLQRLDELYGSNLAGAGSDARGAFQLADPSLIPTSGQGVVSTGRIAASSAIGAQLLGDVVGTRSGAAAGLIGGMLSASPAVMSRAGRGAYKAEKLMTPIIQNAPESIYRQMLLQQNREEQ